MNEQLYPAPYCVDNARFQKQAEELMPRRFQIRQEWGIPDKAYCVLFVGKFIPKKRPLDLVHAVSNGPLNRSGRLVHLLFAGSGELGPEIRRRCTVIFEKENENWPSLRGGISSEAEAISHPPASFVGFLNQTEISKAYVAADCLVLPSDARETWGLVVNEAMACGTPCIVNNACGCHEDLVDSLSDRLTFRTGDTEGLAQSLRFLMARPFPRRILQDHVSKFSIMHTVKTAHKLYQGKT